jgi:hypothetical protein
VRGRWGQGRWDWLTATAPGVFVVVVEGLARIVTALFDAHGPVTVGLVALLIGFGAAIVVAVAFPFIRDEGGFAWSLFSIGVSFIGLSIGFFLLWESALSVCTGATCDP